MKVINSDKFPSFLSRYYSIALDSPSPPHTPLQGTGTQAPRNTISLINTNHISRSQRPQTHNLRNQTQKPVPRPLRPQTHQHVT